MIRKTLGAVLACWLVLAGCGDADSGTDPPPSSEPVDWEDPARAVSFDGGWTVRACEGDAPLLCVERDGATVGVVEATAYPIASFDDLDPDAEESENLAALAAGFLTSLRADRAAGCGAGYGFEDMDAEEAIVGGRPGITYGFTGTTAGGQPSELNLQYATIVGDQIVAITAAAYDEGGCPGRDDLSTFDSATLAAFRPHLDAVLANSPLPPVA